MSLHPMHVCPEAEAALAAYAGSTGKGEGTSSGYAELFLLENQASGPLPSSNDCS